ncbi:hypothetical protein FRACYDRAFT_261899 [Fragilariopsis cylindrus CCMP1102]|uniref:Uncharacterized protein n=1 Tax=Fragilariopsis cylindrus CCMP1102 TaxID=635003 RepID=A0A1E7F7P5_9STRA|nr:hypothetical protein FRACYDRAFT_261899 [Fragilariopsis cylindrus CCMP1102]|eukprot:OEU14176.1 hypothetical protein FRACYDRAFT_261899 [Fragilariopsis cylindrus CCMP1102]
MGRRIRSSHDNKRSSSNNNKSSLSLSSLSSFSSLLKIISWFLFGLAQCILIKKYHDAAYKHSTNTNTNYGGSSTRTSADDTHFEQELILQGIGGIGGIGGTGKSNKNKNRKSSSTTTTSSSSESESSTSQQEEQQKQKRKILPEPDGIFNGYPIYKFPPRTKNKKDKEHKNKNNKKNKFENHDDNDDLYSQFHCVGETWESPIQHRRSKVYVEQTWMHRSCKFQLLCYDTFTEEYVIYLDPSIHNTTSTTANTTAGTKSTSTSPVNNTETETTASTNSSPLIQKLIEKQIENSRKIYFFPKQHLYKQPSYFDDTSTIYRNTTIIVDGAGQAIVDQYWTTNDKNVKSKYGDTSYGVAIGSMNGKWGEIDGQRLKWFPTIRYKSLQEDIEIDIELQQKPKNKNYDVYTLPSSVIMIPFHSLSASNPGHLVWDDFLPMYTLLEMYGFLHSDIDDDNDDNSSTGNEMVDLLPIRYILPGERGLWAGCDWLDTRAKACHKMLQKFAILMGTKRSKQKYFDEAASMSNIPNQTKVPITTNKAIELQLFNKQDQEKQHRPKHKRQKVLICSKNGLAGFGGISDHGDGKVGHGWERKDYKNKNNKEVQQIIPNKITDLLPNEPLLVIFSAYSSETRGIGFKREAEHLRNTINLDDTRKFYGLPSESEMNIVVETHKLSQLSLEEQIILASKTAVFITYCGGGAITASFLPKGSSVIIYYREKGGAESNRHTGLPARLDWDFFNNLGYLHVNWIPADSRLNTIDEQPNENLILEELSRVYKLRKLHYNN